MNHHELIVVFVVDQYCLQWCRVRETWVGTYLPIFDKHIQWHKGIAWMIAIFATAHSWVYINTWIEFWIVKIFLSLVFLQNGTFCEFFETFTSASEHFDCFECNSCWFHCWRHSKSLGTGIITWLESTLWWLIQALFFSNTFHSLSRLLSSQIILILFFLTLGICFIAWTHRTYHFVGNGHYVHNSHQ
jgi:hypothetical protein